MAEREFSRVKTGDIVVQAKKGQDFADVYSCVIADEDVFVLARPAIKLLPDGGCEIVGYKKDNCKVYDNNQETLERNCFYVEQA